MAKVESPTFHPINGELSGCTQCPFESPKDAELCKKWWRRNGSGFAADCPNADNYDEACKFAEEQIADISPSKEK